MLEYKNRRKERERGEIRERRGNKGGIERERENEREKIERKKIFLF